MKDFMLAGVSSNVGKTTVTMGIMAALRARGEAVHPFKTGPDYIDPMFHTFVTGQSSINLDTWILDPETVRLLHYGKMTDDAVGVVEGVMGLYDGHGVKDDVGSSAYLSKVLGIPVFLIINGRGMSKSAAALVKGYVDFDPEVRVAGVIVNRLSSESHYHLLKEMIETHAGVPCVGWMPECPELAVNSRHLGLIPVDELADIREKVDQAAALAEAHIDLDQMLSLSETICPEGLMADPFKERAGQYKGLRIGIPRDQAFNFYYQDNLSALKVLGVELVFFSPLADGALPDNLDGLYIGGGFPEVFGKEFEENQAFRENARQALEEGLPCFAECGGLMVLTQCMADKTGDPTKGIGFLPARTVMTKRLQRFGYVEVSAKIGEQHISTRAHEFHHSLVEVEEALPTAYTVSKGNKQWHCGYVKNNTIAGYPHIHFYSNPQFLIALLDGAMEVKHAKGRG